jgi:hypothetical protein
VSDTSSLCDDAAVSAVRSAEHTLERAYWDVHCHDVAVQRAEEELSKNASKLEKALAKLAVARQVHAAVAAQFPDVERQEIDTHGI